MVLVRELKYCCPPLTFGNLSMAACDLGDNRLRICTDLAENGLHHTLFLLEHRRQDMLRLDLLVLAFFG